MSTPAQHDRRPAQAPGAPISPAANRRMLVVVNPHATTVSDELRELVLYALQGRYDLDAVDTEARGHATELCRQAASEEYDVVVTFGGDGTVNEAANGLAGSDTPLCCLPGGSANVFAKLLGIPADIIDATEHLLSLAESWRVRPVDLGTVNGRCFTFASGVGLDASVVQRVDANPHMKARLGAYYFTWIAIGTFTRRYLRKPPRMEVCVGGQTLAGVTAIVQNGSTYTYFNNHPIHIAEGATLDSGTLAGGVLRHATPLSGTSIAWRALSTRARVTRQRQVSGFQGVRELTVRTTDGRPLPLQVDGDYLGDFAEAHYSILPRGLNVVA
ncbi:MAG TPA: diacylglycerol kinase family protein [Solirubrobacteraceae bacterium]|nr:diacylglycerol kinase family protein [Solirubrobacteraceae bacterium]